MLKDDAFGGAFGDVVSATINVALGRLSTSSRLTAPTASCRTS